MHVLCVNIDELLIERIRGQASSVSIEESDFATIMKCGVDSEARVVFVGWDKVGGLAHRLARALEVAKPAPIVVAICHADSPIPDEQDREEIRISHWINLPQQFFKITQILYEIQHRPDDVEDLSQLEALIPKPIEVSALLKRVREHIEDYQNRRSSLDEVGQGPVIPGSVQAPLSLQRIGVFYPDEGIVGDITKSLAGAGFLDVSGFSDISAIFERLRAEGLDLVISYYDGNDYQTVTLLQEANEARDLDRFATLILCPNKSSLAEWASVEEQIFYDRVAIFTRQKPDLIMAVQAAYQAAQQPDSPVNILHKMRKPWRFGAKDHDRTIIPPNLLDGIVKRVEEQRGMVYWSQAERVLHLILGRQYSDAQKMADRLQEAYPASFDGDMINYLVQAHDRDRSQVGDDIVKNMLIHRDMNLEKCYRLGKQFAFWKVAPPLCRLLNEWIPREDLMLDHQFYFFAGVYYGLIQEPEIQGKFLQQAVAMAPLRAEYLVELVKYFYDSRRWELAKQFWDLTKQTARSQVQGLDALLAKAG